MGASRLFALGFHAPHALAVKLNECSGIKRFQIFRPFFGMLIYQTLIGMFMRSKGKTNRLLTLLVNVATLSPVNILAGAKRAGAFSFGLKSEGAEKPDWVAVSEMKLWSDMQNGHTLQVQQI